MHCYSVWRIFNDTSCIKNIWPMLCILSLTHSLRVRLILTWLKEQMPLTSHKTMLQRVSSFYVLPLFFTNFHFAIVIASVWVKSILFICQFIVFSPVFFFQILFFRLYIEHSFVRYPIIQVRTKQNLFFLFTVVIHVLK